jgi:hypothetical protein
MNRLKRYRTEYGDGRVFETDSEAEYLQHLLVELSRNAE